MTRPAPTDASPEAAPDRPTLPALRHRTLPPAGPAWYGAVMGTGILSSLTMIHGVPVIPPVLLVLGWLLLLGLTGAYLIRCVRQRGLFWTSFHQADQAPAWGMVAMGILAVGSATATVVSGVAGAASDAAALAWKIDGILWLIGTALGLFSATTFVSLLIRTDAGAPRPVWGLPVVAPMVSATVGAGLAPHLSSHGVGMLVAVASFGCFLMALPLGATIFATAYHHAWFRDPLPLAASVSSFIPLGIVGQSTAAAQTLAGAFGHWIQDDAAGWAQLLAHAYGITVFLLGAPLFLWAVFTSYRAVARGMGFNPGWWASTFPVGTCSLGAHAMGWDGLSIAFLILLAAHWTVCAGVSLAALWAQRTR